MPLSIFSSLLPLTLASCFLPALSPCVQGNCYFNGETYACKCDQGYTDRFCNTSTSLCSEISCQNKGICLETSGTCDCTGTLFTGTLCQAESITCSPSPCLHDSPCTHNAPNNITCACLGTGYSGQHCQTAKEGDCRVSKYECSASSAQCLTNPFTDVAQCQCYLFYVGDRCQTNLLIFILLGVALLALIALFFFLRRKYPKADNTVIFGLFLTVVDLVGDVLFLDSQAGNPTIFAALAVFLVVPMAVNCGFLVFILYTMLKYQPDMRTWLQNNVVVAAGVFVLSVTNIEAMQVLSSGLLNKQSFLAPFSPQNRHHMMIGGFLGHLLEDIPQLCIQSYVASSNLDTLTLLTMTASSLSLLFGVVRRLLTYAIAFFSGQLKYKHQIDEPGDDPEGKFSSVYTMVDEQAEK